MKLPDVKVTLEIEGLEGLAEKIKAVDDALQRLGIMAPGQDVQPYEGREALELDLRVHRRIAQLAEEGYDKMRAERTALVRELGEVRAQAALAEAERDKMRDERDALQEELGAARLRQQDERTLTAYWQRLQRETEQALRHQVDKVERAAAIIKKRDEELEALRRKDAESSLLRDRLAHAEQQVADMRWLLNRVKEPA